MMHLCSHIRVFKRKWIIHLYSFAFAYEKWISSFASAYTCCNLLHHCRTLVPLSPIIFHFPRSPLPRPPPSSTSTFYILLYSNNIVYHFSPITLSYPPPLPYLSPTHYFYHHILLLQSLCICKWIPRHLISHIYALTQLLLPPLLSPSSITTFLHPYPLYSTCLKPSLPPQPPLAPSPIKSNATALTILNHHRPHLPTLPHHHHPHLPQTQFLPPPPS